MGRLPDKLTYSNVVSTLCLVLLLGGGVAYAASKLPPNSVGTEQLKANAVTGAKIRNAAVSGAKVKDGSLSAADLAPGALPPGPAGPVGERGPAGERGPVGAEGPPGAGLEPATYIDAGLPDGLGGCGSHKGFVNWDLGSPVERVGYYRGPDGTVHLKGTGVQCSPYDGVVLQLPAGYRPAGASYFLGVSPESTERVQIEVSPDGAVVAFVANVVLPVSIDGINFRCGPSGSAGCP